MNENVLLMRKAKSQLSGYWSNALIASLIYIAIMGVVSSTTIVEFILYGPLTFGYYLYLACLADTRQDNLNLLFRGFDRFVETLIAGLLICLAVGIGYCLLIVPGIILSCGFSMTFFIMIDDPNISGIDAIKRSWEMMTGHKWDLFCLWIRFFGWCVLGILTCGIGFLWIQPYITLSTLNFYRKLRYGTF